MIKSIASKRPQEHHFIKFVYIECCVNTLQVFSDFKQQLRFDNTTSHHNEHAKTKQVIIGMFAQSNAELKYYDTLTRAATRHAQRAAIVRLGLRSESRLSNVKPTNPPPPTLEKLEGRGVLVGRPGRNLNIRNQSRLIVVTHRRRNARCERN